MSACHYPAVTARPERSLSCKVGVACGIMTTHKRTSLHYQTLREVNEIEIIDYQFASVRNSWGRVTITPQRLIRLTGVRVLPTSECAQIPTCHQHGSYNLISEVV